MQSNSRKRVEEQEEKDNLNLQNNYGIKKPEEKQDEYYAEKVDKQG